MSYGYILLLASLIYRHCINYSISTFPIVKLSPVKFLVVTHSHLRNNNLREITLLHAAVLVPGHTKFSSILEY